MPLQNGGSSLLGTLRGMHICMTLAPPTQIRQAHVASAQRRRYVIELIPSLMGKGMLLMSASKKKNINDQAI